MLPHREATDDLDHGFRANVREHRSGSPPLALAEILGIGRCSRLAEHPPRGVAGFISAGTTVA